MRACWTACLALACVANCANGAPMGARNDAVTVDHFDQMESSPPIEAANLEATLAELGRTIPANDAVLRRRYARYYCWNHRFVDGPIAGIAFANAQLGAAVQSHDLVAISDLTLCRAYQQQLLGRDALAQADYDAAVKTAQDAQDARMRGFALTARGAFESQRGRFSHALSDLLAGQRIYEELRLDYWKKANLVSIGDVYRRLGDCAHARDYYRQALTDFVKPDDLLSVAYLRTGTGLCYLDEGRNSEALSEFNAVLALHGQVAGIPDRDKAINLAIDRVNLARTLLNLKRYKEALTQGLAAKPVLDPKYHGSYLAVLEITLAEAYVALEMYGAATDRLNAAEPYILKIGDLNYRSRFHDVRARVLFAQGSTREAYLELRRLQEAAVAQFKIANELSIGQLTVQFDTERKIAENKALVAEQRDRERELATMKTIRLWQTIFIALVLMLLLLLVAFGIRQIGYAKKLKIIAETDELTRLRNRRSIMALGLQEIDKSKAGGVAVSFLAFDIDFFKHINDRYGHEAGDHALKAVAKVVSGTMRDFDRVGRTGGEEFLVILPITDLEQAIVVANRVRKAVGAAELDGIEPGLKLTISIGVAQAGEADKELADVLRRADAALYRAKVNGRNRVECDPIPKNDPQS